MTIFTTPESLATEIKNLKELIDDRARSNQRAIEIAADSLGEKLKRESDDRYAIKDDVKEIEKRIDNYPDKYASKNDVTTVQMKINELELFYADIKGRVWTLGIVMTILIILLEFVMHFVIKAHGS